MNDTYGDRGDVVADIFVSYAREDTESAERLARTLEGFGWTVFWDRSIPTGERWQDVLEAELSRASTVIVLWSVDSVSSRWVNAEAAEARDAGKLLPVRLDDARPPLGQRDIEAADLTGWMGDAADPEFQGLIRAVASQCGGMPSLEQSAVSRDSQASRRPLDSMPASVLALGGVAVVVVVVLLLWRLTDESPTRPDDETGPQAAELVIDGRAVEHGTALDIESFISTGAVERFDLRADNDARLFVDVKSLAGNNECREGPDLYWRIVTDTGREIVRDSLMDRFPFNSSDLCADKAVNLGPGRYEFEVCAGDRCNSDAEGTYEIDLWNATPVEEHVDLDLHIPDESLPSTAGNIAFPGENERFRFEVSADTRVFVDVRGLAGNDECRQGPDFYWGIVTDTGREIIVDSLMDPLPFDPTDLCADKSVNLEAGEYIFGVCAGSNCQLDSTGEYRLSLLAR